MADLAMNTALKVQTQNLNSMTFGGKIINISAHVSALCQLCFLIYVASSYFTMEG